jgi:C1A family cysteine protease
MHDRLGLSELSAAPESFTLYNDVNRVLDQGSTNSCVAQALAGAIDILESRAGLKYQPASRLFMYYNARAFHGIQKFDKGTFIRTCCRGLSKFGVPDEKYWKFYTNPMIVNRRPGWNPYMNGFGRKGGEYFKIKEFGSDLVYAIKAALLEGYPVAFGTLVTKDFLDNTGPDIIDIPNGTDKTVGGHAMLIIGYVEDSDGLRFHVLNSWGHTWRLGGTAFLTEDYIRWTLSRDFTIIRGWARISQV